MQPITKEILSAMRKCTHVSFHLQHGKTTLSVHRSHFITLAKNEGPEWKFTLETETNVLDYTKSESALCSAFLSKEDRAKYSAHVSVTRYSEKGVVDFLAATLKPGDTILVEWIRQSSPLLREHGFETQECRLIISRKGKEIGVFPFDVQTLPAGYLTAMIKAA